jgi:hypothetical protein
MHQIPAADVKRGMVVEYHGARIAVGENLPGLVVATLIDPTGTCLMRVPYGQTVTYLHDTHATR